MYRLLVESTGFDTSYDVTDDITNILAAAPVRSSLVNICVVGSTAGLTIMRYEPGSIADLLRTLNAIAPSDGTYEHFRTTGDPNGSAHVKSALLGCSVTIPFDDGKIAMSETHRIVLIDFDLKDSIRTLWIDAPSTLIKE